MNAIMIDEADIERVLDLIESMPGQRVALIELIEEARSPEKGSIIDERVFATTAAPLSYSVYGPVALRRLLEEAGALSYELRDGGVGGLRMREGLPPFVEGEERVEGGELLRVAVPEEGLWVATEAGLKAVERLARQTAERALRLVDLEGGRYRGLLADILKVCDGASQTTLALDGLVDRCPAAQEPRRYGGYFVQRLADAGALRWDNGWITTKEGRGLRERLVESVAASPLR